MSHIQGVLIKRVITLFLTDLQKSIVLIILKTHLRTFANKLPMFDYP